jgi:hypothetical protein
VQEPSLPFAACVSADAQWSYDELLCIYRAGLQHGALQEARARLRRLGGGSVDRPWPTLVLAHATLYVDEAQAIRDYEMAAAGFGRTREADGEVVARQNLQSLYRRRGDIAAATRQVELAVAAADASKVPLTVARASVLQAAHLMETGGDIGRAHRTLLAAERLAFPRGPIGLRREILFLLGQANVHLGRLDDGADAFERHRALRQEDGSPVDAAAAAYNILNIHVVKNELRPSASARAPLVAMAERVVAEAHALERPFIEAQAHRVVGDLVRQTDPDRSLTHLRRCVDLSTSGGFPEVRASCVWTLSALEVARNPARAEQLSREAIAAVTASGGGSMLAFAWQARLRMVWRTLAEDEAVAESLNALEAIERLRATQNDEGVRAALFSSWTRDYYWLAGRLLDLRTPRLDRAFEVGERLRARVLLEHLARSGVPGPADADREALGRDLGRRISDTQRRLASTIAGPERRSLLDELRLLELERGELVSAAAVPPQALPFATLDAVRQALDETEVMLWFLVAPWEDLYGDFGGGSWVLVITRQGVRIERLATRVELDAQVSALAGLLRQRDAPAPVLPAEHLGRTLLGSALRDLPPHVDKLVIVSDGALHRLPFEVLRLDPAQPPIGERFEISIAPSATVWLRLRHGGWPSAPTGDVLVLADPDVPHGTVAGDVRLEPLPWARKEAAAIARVLRLDASAVHAGGAASESMLKRTPPGRYSVLHLAAHARADDVFPDRSAVFLAGGGPDDDGWLQPADIVALDLRGGLVVLSACESADGALVSGEGPLSLARAFFAGGAGSVVATRWPLRDDDAAFLMERFYRALGAGATAGAALRTARLEAIASGQSASAWTGVTLLGDGRRAPIRARAVSHIRWQIVVPAGLLAAAVSWYVFRPSTTSRFRLRSWLRLRRR